MYILHIFHGFYPHSVRVPYGQESEQSPEYGRRTIATHFDVKIGIESLDIPAGCFPSLVETNISHYLNREKAVKKSLTILAWLNDLAVERNIKFSETLQDALMVKLNIQQQTQQPPAAP